MKTSVYLGTLSFSIVLVIVASSSAYGQAGRRPIRRYQSSVAEPYVSPYFSLIRPGADPSLNYMTAVQPQLVQERNAQFQAGQIQSLRQNVQQQQQALNSPYGKMGGIRPTGGHAASYGNLSHYYPGGGRGGSGGGAPRKMSSGSGGGMGGFGFGGGF
jgi:hypothetical protein